MTHRELVDRFLSGLSAGHVDDTLLTDDMVFWSVNSGESERMRFQQGIGLLAKIANNSIVYQLQSLVSEGSRCVADVSSQGTLMDGNTLENRHAFLFRLEGDRIARVDEFMNQYVVAEKVAPLMQRLMAEQSQG